VLETKLQNNTSIKDERCRLLKATEVLGFDTIPIRGGVLRILQNMA
jgi:hypothetical protein